MTSVTVNPQSITVYEAPAPSTSTAPSCKVGMYITINGQSYPYQYDATIPNGYVQTSTPNFCIYYEGGKAPTGCYCTTSNQIVKYATMFFTNNNGGYYGVITLNYQTGTYQFGISWSEL